MSEWLKGYCWGLALMAIAQPIVYAALHHWGLLP